MLAIKLAITNLKQNQTIEKNIRQTYWSFIFSDLNLWPFDLKIAPPITHVGENLFNQHSINSSFLKSTISSK